MNPEFQLKESLKKVYEKQNIELSDCRSISALNKVENIIRLTNGKSNSKILEIGAGDGAILDKLSKIKYGDSYYATEITQSAVKTINSRNIEGLKEAVLFNGYSTSFKDDEFDLVILSHVLEHVEYPRKLLYEAARIGREIFIEVPLEDNNRLTETFTLTDVGHINFYNYKTIQLLVQSCGLTIERKILTYPNRKSKRNLKQNIKFKIINHLPSYFYKLAVSNFTYNLSLLLNKS